MGWSALKTGLASRRASSLFLSHTWLFSGRLISRFGRHRSLLGHLSFATGWFGTPAIGLEPNAMVIVIGMIPTGIGVGLTFPTLMGVSGGAFSSVFVRHGLWRQLT